MSKGQRRPSQTARAPAPSLPTSTARTRLLCLGGAGAIALLALACYWPVFDANFIWDDDDYVVNNQTLREVDGLRRLWVDKHANSQYYPLVHTTFWVEYHLWNIEPLGYHVVNVVLHIANAILLLSVLRRLAVPGAFWAAALFAVHPVMVESVAWVTERKNVLSGFFYLAAFRSLLCFWPPEESEPRLIGRRWLLYGAATLFFAAALFSKTVACSLPAAFLVVRWWKNGRITLRDVLIMVPWFALGALLAMTTAFLEKEHVGAQGKEWDLSLLDRVLIAGRALWFYAGKLLWPYPLIFIYPRWRIDAFAWWQYFYPAAAVATLIALWAWRGRIGRGPLAAALFFAGTLFPALGFFNVFPMRYSFVADHFQYLAAIGLFALAGAGWDRLVVGSVVRPWAATGGGLLLLVLVALSREQTGDYQDLSALWNNTIAKNPECWMAYNNRSDLLQKPGTPESLNAAIADLSRALELNNDNWEAYGNRGNLYNRLGQHQLGLGRAHLIRAIEFFELGLRDLNRALELNAGVPDNYQRRGQSYHNLGRFREAVADYTQALELVPNRPGYLNDRGWSYQQLGEYEAAIADFNRAIELFPEFAGAYYNRATAHQLQNNLNLALLDYDRAIQLYPQYWEAFANRGGVLSQQEQYSLALEDFDRALKLRPNAADVYIFRADARWHLKLYQGAREDLEQGIRLEARPSRDLVERIHKTANGIR
jgi:protein O-mannosyl-transferase